MTTAVRFVMSAALLGAVTLASGSGDIAAAQTKGQGVKKPATQNNGIVSTAHEHHVKGIVEHVHHEGPEHGHILVKVHVHHDGRAGTHVKEERFTVGPHTKIHVEGKGHHHHGLGALHHGEHVTIIAHEHHADVIIIHHHHRD